MPKEKKAPTTCTLGIHPGDRNGKCPDPSACAHCGWHPEEARARAWAIRAIGLETGPDGLQRLVLRRKQAAADAPGADGDQAGKRHGTRSAPAAAGTAT